MLNTTLINSISPLLGEARELMPGEHYGSDGLIYCDTCGEPKQAFIDILGESRIRTRHCACDRAELDRRDALMKQQALQYRAERLRAEAFTDSRYARCRIELDDHSNEKLSAIIRNYAHHFEELFSKGKGLLFFGPVGTGKSFAAAAIVNAVIDQGHPCLMSTMTRLVNDMGEAVSKNSFLDSLHGFDLLVIDDFGTERNSEYMQEQVYTIIDERLRSCRPMILTTNMSAEALKGATEITKQRVLSRVKQVCTPFKVDGIDRRVKQLEADYTEDMRLLTSTT